MTRLATFEKLLEPASIGSVKTRNRIIKTAQGTHYSNDNHFHMNQRTLAFYEALARGGVGLIIVESPSVDHPAGGDRHRLDDDKYIDGYRELTKVIHKHGCPTFLQLYHNGPMGRPGSQYLVAASPVMLKSDTDMHNQMPRELTMPEIEELVDKFASAAVRAQKAGFDGVEINAGSSHLLHNFISPFWNRRQDVYGGSVENRARFLIQIIQETKSRLGDSFPVTVIINGIEIGQAAGIDNNKCLTAEDSRRTAKLIEKAGVNAIHVRHEWLGAHQIGWLPDLCFYPEPPVPLKSFPKEYNSRQRGAGANVYLAAGMKKTVSIPVITVGRIDPFLGERILEENKADFIGMTRPLCADPELPNKIAAGRLADVRPCTHCNTCTGSYDHTVARRCRINASMGTEHTLIEKTSKPKKVVVIGGGPAGLEAARIAALRGHEVILCEKSTRLGGLLPLASVVKGVEIEDLPAVVNYFERQLHGLGVQIRLGTEATPSAIEEIRPDVVLLATGGIPTEPDIPGIKGRNVVSNAALHRKLKFYLRFLKPGTLRRLTKFWMPVGQRVVILGGTLHGCELAEFLVKRGRKVTVVETSETLTDGMPILMRPYLLSWLRKKGVTMITDAKYEEITDKGLTIVTKEGDKQSISADTFIPALPLTQNLQLLDRLRGFVSDIYAIGDCQNPGLIADAIADGWRIANSI
jgi:2,4-dienoyl-CoA reductase (NADPH2)